MTIPHPVALGCLRAIARWYEQRVDALKTQGGGSLQQSIDWTAPPESERLWAPYRRYPGV